MAEKETKKEGTEVVPVEETTAVSTNLFGAPEGQNFLVAILGQNFKQVKETLIQRKVEDIERILSRKIQDNILDLKRKYESIQDDLLSAVPTTALQTLNLNSIDPRNFCEGLSKWRLECHNSACDILSDINIYQSMFGKNWPEEDKKLVKNLILDFKNI